MKKYPRKYSPLERKIDQLWQVYDDAEKEKFWRVYNGFLTQAKAKGASSYQDASPISKKRHHSFIPQTFQVLQWFHSVKAHLYVLCLTVLFLAVGSFITNRPIRKPKVTKKLTEQPVTSKKPIEPAVAEGELVYEPLNIDTTHIYSWQYFEVKNSCKAGLAPALPDSLAIAYYKMYMAREWQAILDQRMLESKHMKEQHDSLWRLNKQQLIQVYTQYRQVYDTYAKTRKERELNYQHIENAWCKVMHKSRLPKNIDKHNKPVYELVVNDEAQWLFFADMEELDLYRVREYKGAYFIVKPMKWEENIKLEPIDLTKQVMYKAQIKVYYQGKLVTYTPQKVYYELNGKQNNIAVKDFDKLEKKLEISQHYPKVK
jgi:hypothetical protein